MDILEITEVALDEFGVVVPVTNAALLRKRGRVLQLNGPDGAIRPPAGWRARSTGVNGKDGEPVPSRYPRTR